MYRIIIVENDNIQNKQLEQAVRAFFSHEIDIKCYLSAEDFYECGTMAPPDIALLDIQLSGDSGVQLAMRLNESAPQCQIIYLTSFIDYAGDVYCTRHLWFIPKRRAEEFLPKALEQACINLKREQSSVLSISLKDGIRILLQSEIFYLERERRVTHIAAVRETVNCSEPLATLAERLQKDLFVRCHNSYIVNLRHIRHFHRTELEVSNGDRILVSRQYYAQTRDLFGRYISEITPPAYTCI